MENILCEARITIVNQTGVTDGSVSFTPVTESLGEELGFFFVRFDQVELLSVSQSVRGLYPAVVYVIG